MKTTKQDIEKVVECYFKGTFEGDRKMLEECFHPMAHITGHYNEQAIDLCLGDFIKRVLQQQAEGVNKVYDKSIISIDVQQEVAVVKAKVRVGDDFFIDYLSLMTFDHQWKIRHKVFTNINSELTDDDL
jgi:hypothetical protein